VALGIALGVAGYAACRSGGPTPLPLAPPRTDLRGLVERLSPVAKCALESAAGLALQRSHYRVEVEHWLLRLAEDADSDLAQLGLFYELLARPLIDDLRAAVARFEGGDDQVPILSSELVRLLRLAWAEAESEFGAEQLRSSHVLYAALTDRRLAPRLGVVSPEFGKVDVESLRERLTELVPAAEESQF
jgi:type VI secretion system protein VasG